MKKIEKEKAIQLRQNGISVKKIAKELSVAASTVSLWVRHIILSDEQKTKILCNKTPEEKAKRAKTFSETYRQRRQIWQEHGRNLAKQNDPLHIMGCMLYWGEGGKTSVSTVSISNCDVEILKVFVDFLITCYNVDKNRLKISIQFYKDISTDEDVKNFWLTNLNLTDCNIQQIKGHEPKQNKTHKKQPYGVCRICLGDVQIKQSIMGAIQEYGKFDNPSWLG
jgi:transposase-like protein